MTENNVLINNQTGEKARAVLISLKTPSMTDDGVEVSLDELERLLETAGGETVLRVVQSRESPIPPHISEKARRQRWPNLLKTTAI